MTYLIDELGRRTEHAQLSPFQVFPVFCFGRLQRGKNILTVLGYWVTSQGWHCLSGELCGVTSAEWIRLSASMVHDLQTHLATDLKPHSPLDLTL